MNRRKFFPLLLILCLVVQLVWTPVSVRAEAAVGMKGTIEVTILFPYELKQRPNDINLSLFYGEQELLQEVPLDALEAQGLDITVTLTDSQGNLAVQGEYYSTAALTFRGFPVGEYRFVLSGDGYKTYETTLILQQYSQYLVVANNNNTFTAGDLNGDGVVDGTDLVRLKEKLNQFDPTYDLNRDGVLDIIDYAYLYNNIREGSGDEAILKNTTLIPDAFLDLDEISRGLAEYGVSETEAKQLFSGEGSSAVLLQSPQDQVISEKNPVEFNIPFLPEETLPELQYVVMTVPENSIAPSQGEILFEDIEGNRYTEKFNQANVASINNAASELRLFAEPASRQIVIDFGRRIPVKRVTIKITGTAEDSKLTSIAKVEFLQEMTSTPQEEINRVKNVTAQAMDSGVSLSWAPLANVTEYVVRYGTASGEYTSEYPASGTSCMIQGLENDILYYFVVLGKNGEWVGTPSEEVSCMPFAKEAPGRVGGVSVKSMNGALAIQWGAEKHAESYKLFYKERDAESYQVITGITEPEYYLAGLTNGVEYYIMVSAVNAYGEGAKSPEASGIPELIEVKEPEGIPTYNEINRSHITGIRLSHPDHYNKTYYPNGIDPWTMVDGDYTTDWVARGNWWENQGFVVTFDQAYEMDHMVWVTRLDDNIFKSTIDRYYIEVWGENDDLSKGGTVLVAYGTKLAKNPGSKDGLEILTFPKASVKQIRVSTKMKDGGPAPHSASELKFYEYYSLVDDINALFGDVLHTKLSAAADAEKILEYQNRISGSTGEFYVDKEILQKELEIAQSLLPGNTPLQNITEAETGRNAGNDGNRNFAYTLNDLQPLGISAKTGETLIIYVEPGADGVLPVLVASQYAGEAGNWSQTISLNKGRNIITVPKFDDRAKERGGALYLKYYGQGGAKINLFGGTQIPMLNLPEFSFETITFSGTDFSDPSQAKNKAAVQAYIEELEAYAKNLTGTAANLQNMILNTTDIATEHVLLSLPAKVVANALSNYSTLEEKTEALYGTLAAWEKNMQIHYTVCGLSANAAEEKNQYPSSRINVRYMTITGKAFMYAGGAHIGIGYGSGSGLVNAPLSKATKGLFGWGINHEIGHVLDQVGISKPETTNNIHSLFSQTFDGENYLGTTRLEGGIYESVFQKTAYGAPGISNNVFVQLAMYWQLHLTYDGIKENSYDFYYQLYQLLRSGSVTAENPEMLFVRLACDIVQKDLSEFFTRWGYQLTEETKAYISKYDPEQRPIYYGNDNVKRYLNNGGSPVLDGTALTVEASQKTESTGQASVILTISLPEGVNPNSVLGYEIRRNGKVLTFVEADGVSKDTIYTDTDIAVNNSVMEYSVVAYDLAYGTAQGSSGTFKLSYEGILDNSKFNFQLNGSTVTMESETANELAGIRIYTGEGSKIVVLPEEESGISVFGETAAVSGSAIASGSALKAKVQIGEEDFDVLLTPAYEKDGYTTYYFSATGDSEDGRIQTYTTKKLTLEFSQVDCGAEELSENLWAVRYPGDDIDFYHPEEQAYVGILGEDYYYDGGQIAKGTIIVAGTFRGDPVYNVVMLKGIYSELSEEGDDNAENPLTEQTVEGEQLLFAVLPENGVMTNISNGMWLYLPDWSADSKLPDTIRAELYRVDNPETLEGQRLVSNTLSFSVPSYESLPVIYLTNTAGNK